MLQKTRILIGKAPSLCQPYFRIGVFSLSLFINPYPSYHLSFFFFPSVSLTRPSSLLLLIFPLYSDSIEHTNPSERRRNPRISIPSSEASGFSLIVHIIFPSCSSSTFHPRSFHKIMRPIKVLSGSWVPEDWLPISVADPAKFYIKEKILKGNKILKMQGLFWKISDFVGAANTLVHHAN